MQIMLAQDQNKTLMLLPDGRSSYQHSKQVIAFMSVVPKIFPSFNKFYNFNFSLKAK